MSATSQGLMSYAGPYFHLLPPLATATDFYLSNFTPHTGSLVDLALYAASHPKRCTGVLCLFRENKMQLLSNLPAIRKGRHSSTPLM